MAELIGNTYVGLPAQTIHSHNMDSPNTSSDPPAHSSTTNTPTASASDSDSEQDLGSNQELSDGFEWLDELETYTTRAERNKFNIGNLNIDMASPFFFGYAWGCMPNPPVTHGKLQ